MRQHAFENLENRALNYLTIRKEIADINPVTKIPKMGAEGNKTMNEKIKFQQIN